MPDGYGRGLERRGGGWGFALRGWSPPWPYVGIGRGGLPRCGYFLSGVAGVSVWPAWGYGPYYSAPPAPFYGARYPYPGAGPYGFQMSKEQELDFLRSQADAIKEELEQIDARIKELEKE